jgi:DNA-directed RNA polymerase specialized sigma24 family protein
MSSAGSVTQWIDLLKGGAHPDAAQQVYNNYFLRLVGLAHQRLQNTPRRAADEEDVALSALDSFFRGAADGRFPHLNDRDDLWQLLVLITDRKAKDLAKSERRQKRGGGRVLDEAALGGAFPAGLGAVPGQEPTPEFATEMAEQCRRLFDALGAGELRQIALWKMESYANEEIADKLKCALRRVERKLALIRSIWKKEGLA